MTPDEVGYVLAVAGLGPANAPSADAFGHSEHYVSNIAMNDGSEYVVVIVRITEGEGPAT